MPVTAFDIALRRPLASGRAFGVPGPYEELRGQLRFAIDPCHPANERIADVALAPRSAAGLVEFSSDVSILLPVDRARASGRLLLDVVNRGNTVAVPNFNRATRPVLAPGGDPSPPIDVGDGFLMRRGFVVLSCGWQCDLPDVPGLIGLQGPEALGPDGRPINGPVYVQLQTDRDMPHLLLSDRGHQAYPAADPHEPGAILLVRDQPDGPAAIIPRERWRFGRVVDSRVVPDACHVQLDGGFDRGRLYQAVYTARGARVCGLGLVALRDAVSWLKHGTEAEGNPVAGRIRWAYAYGRSQTGRLLRTLVYWDLNVDEADREALDGLVANVAGGMRGEFNQRFGQNSKDRPHMMSHLFPFTDTPETDPATGETGALHARMDARGSRLRAMYTNTSAEYHRGDASLIHSDPDGLHDHAPGPRTRVYHFAGTEHGLGVWPPTDTQPAPADPSGAVERSQNLRGVIDYAPLLRACLVNLDRWIVDGVEPPPSCHPRLDDATAVAPAALRPAFDRIPAARYPRHHAVPRRQDWQTLPPRPGKSWGSRVSAVDADGNEIAGIVLPEIRVPLATHAGWNLRHPEIGGAEQLLVFAGATLPFARTRRERETSGDPRPSIEERYASRDDYLARVRAAAVDLVRRAYLLEEDIELSVAAGARLWDLFAAGGV
jgi:Alpha/beta hydrolase domain